jgi:hypothetical protein
MDGVGNLGHDELRRLLEEELSLELPPPIGDLVVESVHRGRRMRRTRALWIGAGAGGVALACLIASVFVVAEVSSHRPASRDLGLRASQQPAGAGTVSDAGPARTPSATEAPSPTLPPSPEGHGTEPQANATARGMLELLSVLLPAGKRTTPARASDGGLFVALNLDRGQGVGMVRVNVTGPGSRPPDLSGCPQGSTCRPLPDGNFVEIVDIPENCIERHAVFLNRPDGVSVGILMSSCLSWNGSTNPPGKVVLSVDEAIAIADDPRWGTRMPKSLVDNGQRDFPDLSTFS